jgi:hypothetical protein
MILLKFFFHGVYDSVRDKVFLLSLLPGHHETAVNGLFPEPVKQLDTTRLINCLQPQTDAVNFTNC